MKYDLNDDFKAVEKGERYTEQNSVGKGYVGRR
jgi:hypothetical protein